MPKRVIDFDAMWGSDKLASCAEWAQAEYAWLYGLADASGCFELTNLRVIWGRVAAIRKNLTIERLEQVFDEFQDKGLLFVWEHEGKRYGHWSGSDVPGRLPPPSWRMRLERLAPPVPRKQFVEYMSRFARGRATLPGGSFRGDVEQGEENFKFEISDLKDRVLGCAVSTAQIGTNKLAPPVGSAISDHAPRGANEKQVTNQIGCLRTLKGGIEAAQAQDWNLNLDSDRDVNGDHSRETGMPSERLHAPADKAGREEASQEHLNFPKTTSSRLNSSSVHGESCGEPARFLQNQSARSVASGAEAGYGVFLPRDKSALVARELAVGLGPSCGPVKVKPEALERIRMRDAARNASRSP